MPAGGPFCNEWTDWVQEIFSQDIDILRVYESLWTINIPRGLKELLWKASSGSLPVGRRWHGRSPLGSECRCGHEFTLAHVWEGCDRYDMWPLREVMIDSIGSLVTGNHRTLLVASWPPPYWFPLLCLRHLEKTLNVSKKE